mmetsp:Transcript_660/g.971  ORF Transcript_660/g.971 Transcript_660/m.971 type:complete len:95 (-) Transcript_660:73-357(-)
MSANVQRMHGTELPGGYTVHIAGASAKNAYLCNETHYRALESLRHSREAEPLRLQAAYFLHIPFARNEGGVDDFEALGCAVGTLLCQLLQRAAR